MQLSKADLDLLEGAYDLSRYHDAALMPSSIGDWSRCRKLARFGLLDVIPQARHMDTGREGPAFVLTDEGKMLMAYQAERRARAAKSPRPEREGRR